MYVCMYVRTQLSFFISNFQKRSLLKILTAVHTYIHTYIQYIEMTLYVRDHACSACVCVSTCMCMPGNYMQYVCVFRSICAMTSHYTRAPIDDLVCMRTCVFCPVYVHLHVYARKYQLSILCKDVHYMHMCMHRIMSGMYVYMYALHMRIPPGHEDAARAISRKTVTSRPSCTLAKQTTIFLKAFSAIFISSSPSPAPLISVGMQQQSEKTANHWFLRMCTTGVNRLVHSFSGHFHGRDSVGCAFLMWAFSKPRKQRFDHLRNLLRKKGN